MPTPSLTCCPSGYSYVDGFGYFYDSTGAYLNILNTPFSSPARASCLEQCALFANSAFVTTITDPVDCPCCPEGYSWIPRPSYPSYPNGYCQGILASDITTFIPCVTCTCVSTTDPTCPTCGTAGNAITFTWDFTRSQCTSCVPQDVNNPPGPIQAFLPAQFLDPVTSTFVLRNKNFI